MQEPIQHESGGIAAAARRLGALRIGLAVLAAAVIVLSPGTDTESSYESVGSILLTLVVPALSPLVFAGVTFDMLMARVFMSDAGPAERARLAFVLKFDAVVAVAILIYWLPFFLELRNVI